MMYHDILNLKFHAQTKKAVCLSGTLYLVTEIDEQDQPADIEVLELKERWIPRMAMIPHYPERGVIPSVIRIDNLFAHEVWEDMKETENV